MIISGTIHDSSGNRIKPNVSVEAFEQSFISSSFDRHIGTAETADSGYFKLVASFSLGINLEKIYLIISDPQKIFEIVREGQDAFSPFFDSHGNKKWKSKLLADINNVNIVISMQGRPPPNESYEAVVIGSGFGGTVVALSLANMFEAVNKDPVVGTNNDKRVCILERGQWWVSNEMPQTVDVPTGGNLDPTAYGTIDLKPSMRQYLEKDNIPYATWPIPDNLKGLFRVFAATRVFNGTKGVYDYKRMQNVHVVAGSGVGGGSLVYFNITERPDADVYKDWATQTGLFPPLDRKYSYSEISKTYGESIAQKMFGDVSSDDLDYFGIAENFIGVNKISTTAGLGNFMLPKARVFQEAAVNVNPPNHRLMNGGRDLSVNLSITDIENGVFQSPRPTKVDVNKLSNQNNICQRQGRCGLGCIPGARHTLNKQLYKAISGDKPKPLDIFPLCSVDRIEEDIDDSGYRYKIFFKDYRDDPRGIDRVIKSNTVVLAAGTLGSTEILLRSNNLKLSAMLGRKFSTNGDTFGVINPTKEIVDSSRGPLQTSIAKFMNKDTQSFELSIEDLGVPKMFADLLPAMFSLMMLQKNRNQYFPLVSLADVFSETIVKPLSEDRTISELSRLLGGLDISSSSILINKIAEVATRINTLFVDDKTRAQAPEEKLSNIIMLFGIGRDSSNSKLVLDESNDLTLQEPYDLGQPIFDKIIEIMKLFSQEIGRDEDSLLVPFWNQDNDKRTQITAHPLGGCPMGKSAEEGVVNDIGAVFKGTTGKSTYPGLYIADGSIIPSALGVNPSLTITALAFRIAEGITGTKRYWP